MFEILRNGGFFRLQQYFLLICLFLSQLAGAQTDSSKNNAPALPDSATTVSITYKDTATYYRLNKDYLKSFIPSLTYTLSRPAHWDKKTGPVFLYWPWEPALYCWQIGRSVMWYNITVLT
ncbi:hypothetical protein [Niabella hibiscisoli]|uniref:hypothetical protein n=1 Tax=Niabella hibiscisoli TaxID=1825928 RepID=UPI001F0D5753|nr:hypothetical protein [Niabella hibiscisoli]MCH5717946.1 hypothetical protein [Niabella hibiscisoli]